MSITVWGKKMEQHINNYNNKFRSSHVCGALYALFRLIFIGSIQGR